MTVSRNRFTPDPLRGTGRTKAMVKALPEDGCVVVVHSRDLIPYIKNMVIDLRGPEFSKSVRFVAIHDLDSLAGVRLPIHVDHFVIEHAYHRHLHRELQQLERLRQYQSIMSQRKAP